MATLKKRNAKKRTATPSSPTPTHEGEGTTRGHAGDGSEGGEGRYVEVVTRRLIQEQGGEGMWARQLHNSGKCLVLKVG